MVNCSYCDKELDRKVFCSNSHKVLFHVKKEAIENTTKYIKKNYDIKPKGHMTPTYPEPTPPKEIFEPQPKPRKKK